MVNDIFSELANDLGVFVPKDDPDNIKLILVQTVIGELENRELALYAEIGVKAFNSIFDKPEYSNLVSELNLINKKLETLRTELQSDQQRE